MKQKKIAVMYDCGTNKIRGLETRISISYDPLEKAENRLITAFTLDQNGATENIVRLELTDEVVEEILEILTKQ